MHIIKEYNYTGLMDVIYAEFNLQMQQNSD